MCGINGIVQLKQQNYPITKWIEEMNILLKHRGPDDEGFYFSDEADSSVAFGTDSPDTIKNRNLIFSPARFVSELENKSPLVALGHRRLSIIDLNYTGHQPMCDVTGNYWIVFNGEIYNYIELRLQLEAKGVKFQTQTDTEVVLNSFIMDGPTAVNSFNGMWSFAIFDKQKNTLFASRDRMGVKPFYYFFNGNAFAFSSEQKALVQLPFVEKAINSKAVFDYFVLSKFEGEEEGFFKDILELPPSHSLSLNLTTAALKKWRYFEPVINKNLEPYTDEKEKEYSANIHTLLENAVKIRLRSDVPVGSCLSGGIDSSSIVSIASKLLGTNKMNVYTASFHEDRIDESKWAKIVVGQTGSKWHQTYPTANELLDDINQLVYSQDIPIWSTSTYAQFRVMKLAKETGIKVVLDGQGSDELFGGYDPYFLNSWKEHYKSGGISEFQKQSSGFLKFPANLKFFGRKYMSDIWLSTLSPDLQLKLRLKLHPELNYLDKDFLFAHKNRLPQIQPSINGLNEKLLTDYYNTRLKSYLKCEDRCSMWHSVESRTPFADDLPLMNYVFSIPGNYKIRNGQLKYLLRKSLKGVIPEIILNRKDKMGYNTPNNQWIAQIKAPIKDVISRESNDYININKLLTDYDTLFSPEGEDNGRLFKLLLFPLWKNNFRLI